ncbi:MAG TPA: efflux RND transporter periplasmic adaptor subunit [Xanthomonadales bacterium]|nr:efflux RND transporter periplasmic adaptor subunit [Xanthomonadales bacterium]
MSSKTWSIVLVVLALAGGYLAGSRFGGPGAAPAGAVSETAPAEREILYWVAPMDPNFRRDKPGKSPMGMDLVPVYADEQEDSQEGGVRISPAVENNLGVRTDIATVRPLWRKIEATGYVSFDESRITHIHLRTQGWVVRLATKAEGDRVAAGDLLFELYSPELLNAQKEFLQALQRGDERLRRGGEEKLRALGMIRSEIDALAASGRAMENIRVVAPQNGVVMALNVREGMYVQPNTTVMSLADLSSVWMQAEIFESQAEWVAVGQAGEARLDYLPGQVFTGQLDYVYPVLDPKTRTLRVRLRFDNRDERLKPNMYAQVSIFGKLQPAALSIPREALIRAPGRDRVVLALGDGRFHVHEVLTGMESGEWVEIIAGIAEGDRVVTSAQFLIDSEASLTGSVKRLESVPETPTERLAENVFASGRVDAVDPGKGRLRVSHGPIEALAWPSMTMEFEVDRGVRLEGIAVGQDIRFALRQEHAGHWVVSQIGARGELDNMQPQELEADAGSVVAAAPRYAARGTVRTVDRERRVLNLAHGPVAELGWPSMTMDFAVDAAVDLGAVKPYDEIHFMMHRGPGGGYVVDEIHVLQSEAGTAEHDHD